MGVLLTLLGVAIIAGLVYGAYRIGYETKIAITQEQTMHSIRKFREEMREEIMNELRTAGMLKKNAKISHTRKNTE